MAGFRALLIVIFIWIAGYTVVTISQDGINLFPQFFGDLAEMGWAGQFNADFMCFLALSALWLSWRHQFTPAGLALGVCGFFGGALFLSAYLLYALSNAEGDVQVLLMGEARANG